MVKKRVTQADVAQRAGVSQTAVSQILNNPQSADNFRASTRDKVIQAANELGYIPSLMARALRTNRTMTIGVIVSFLTDELAIRITRGIKDVAVEMGFGILIDDTEENPDFEARVIDQFQQHQVDGLIFVDSWADPLVYLNDDKFPPMIFAQLRRSNVPQNCVSADNSHGGYHSTRHLLDLGYEKIGHISGPETWSSAIDRVAGYRAALEGYNVSYDQTLVEVGDWEINGGVDATNQLLDRRPDVEAIFVGNDLMAAGAIQAALARGLRVPQDLAIIGHDDRYLAEALSPPLTSFGLPLHEIGRKSAHLLINQLLRRDTRTTPSITLTGSLAIRDTCGASNGSR